MVDFAPFQVISLSIELVTALNDASMSDWFHRKFYNNPCNGISVCLPLFRVSSD